ncbi:FAD-dependent oxidoreductase [Hahella sp. SMD15-11]|uniref:FAD-dependent oxidoreductase n=1 Tax=Thermohahella caldifontis TaxID=3142973 RepID=A0AB39UVW4_9GAMM
MTPRKWLLLAGIALLVAAFFGFGLNDYLSLDTFREHKDALLESTHAHPLLSALTFFALYVLVTALSLPGAAVMTLAAGALFGLLEGTLIVSFASSIGATLAFLASRTLLHDWVQKKFGQKLKALNAGIEKDGAFYLFGLRLVPVFPFFLINLAMGLTPIRTGTFYWVSQLGMLPGTLVYVNAGTQLAQIDSLSGLLSPGLIGSFALLALFPFIARHIMNRLQARRALKGFSRPRQFDRNLVVIGAGSAGLVTSYIATAVKAKVTLIEKHKMGGDCLNTGCVPSKALIRSATVAHEIRSAREYGIEVPDARVDFTAVMERVANVIREVEPHDSVERYTALGVECVEGAARILDPWRVEVNGRILTTRNIVVATGARPFVPPIPGLHEVTWYTSDTIWSLRDKPESLLVLGGGPIGCELAQSFNRLGVRVIQVDLSDRIMPREDPDVSAAVQARFVEEGIELHLGCRAERFERRADGTSVLIARKGDDTVEITFDKALLAIGRRANTLGFGLEELGIAMNPNGTIQVNEFLQSSIPTIYACGDVAGPYQFTHTAAHQAWYAAVNSLFGTFKRFAVDYRVIPWATFTDPEVGRVGLNETDAQAQGIPYEVTRYGLDDLDRAIADGEAHGFVKVLTVPGKDRILGATIVGYHAGELITEFVSAMKHGIGLNGILGTIHIYPTLSEANKYAAGVWKRNHAPQRLLEWVGRYHAWRRGGKSGISSPGTPAP